MPSKYMFVVQISKHFSFPLGTGKQSCRLTSAPPPPPPPLCVLGQSLRRIQQDSLNADAFYVYVLDP